MRKQLSSFLGYPVLLITENGVEISEKPCAERRLKQKYIAISKIRRLVRVKLFGVQQRNEKIFVFHFRSPLI